MKIIIPFGAAAILLSGCADFEPKPVSPTAVAASYEFRTLDAPALRSFIQKNTRRDLATWPPTQWDLELLTLAAYYYHPDLDVARAKWSVAQAGVITAGMRPNPTINVNSQRNANAVGGTSPWTLGLSLDIPIETAGKRGYRVQQASHLSEAARLAIASTAWQVRGRVRAAWLDLQAARQAAVVLLQQQRLQQENVTLLERRLGFGMVSTPEVTQARITLNQGTLALQDNERLQSEVRTRLAGALGLTSKALENIVIAPVGDVESPALPTTEVQKQALLGRADVLGALAEYAASQSALQLQIANQYPDVHLGPGYSWDQGANKWFLGLSVALPVMNHNQGPVAEAKARRTEAMATFTATQGRAIGEVEVALTAYHASRQRLLALEGLVAAQDDQLRRAQASFKAGETDRVALVGSQLEVSQLALARVDALVSTQRALGALEDAVQRPLVGPDELTNAIENNPRQAKESNQ